jgi:hypothetical protein
VRADVVVAQFVFFSRCLSAVDGTASICKVLDADNLFSKRLERYEAAGVPYRWFWTTEEEERKGWQRADILLSVQEYELETIANGAPGRPVVLVPFSQKVIDSGKGDGRSILFVGAGNEANAAGLEAFVNSALPEIRAVHPQVRLVIAGRAGERFRGVAGVDAHGVVPDLDECYRNAFLTINVMTCGTGMKTKTVEALCHGKCLVSTPCGIEGLEGYPEVFHLAGTPDAFGKVIRRLLEQPEVVEQTRQAALRFAQSYFAADVVFGRMEEAIVMRLAEIRARRGSN